MTQRSAGSEAPRRHTPRVESFLHAATGTVSHLVTVEGERAAAVVDPVLDFDPATGEIHSRSADRLLAVLGRRGLGLSLILETHLHADHFSAADYLRERSGAQIVIGAGVVASMDRWRAPFALCDVAPARCFDVLARDGQRLAFGRRTIGVMATPGHTACAVAYVLGDAVFVGDTLFMPDVGTGRADFPGADARALYRSIRRLLALPATKRMFVGHDYLGKRRRRHAWETTVGAQRTRNVHVRAGITEAEFVEMRTRRDAGLSPPDLMLAALQVNLRAGALPPATPDGQRFLRLPVSWVR